MKTYLNKLLNWILYTSTFAAACAVCLSMATERLFLGTQSIELSRLHVLIFGGVLVVYNIHFLLKKSTPDLSDRFGWSQHYRFWHYLAIAAGVLCAMIGLYAMPSSIIVACIVLGMLSFAYSIPLLPLPGKKRLKDYGWVKIIVLSSVWTIVTCVLPILYHGKTLSAYPFEIAIRFVLLFSLCMAFDIRDMQTDIDAGIYTVPNRIGLKKSYWLIDVSIVFFVVFSSIQYIRYPSLSRIIAECVTVFAIKFVVLYARKHPSDRVYLGLVDGVMMLYALLILIK